MSFEEYEERFKWWKDGYVQWHALSVAIAELCVQTEGILVDRAWVTVDRVLPLLSHNVADSKKGALWRPIRKLLRKARERRAEAQLRRLRINQGEEPAITPSQTTQRVQEQRNNTEMPYPPPFSQDTYLQLEKSTTEGQRRTAAAFATEVGPTGIPFNADFSDMSTTASKSSPAILGGQTYASPSAAMVVNPVHQWTIDFGDMDAPFEVAAAAGDEPQQELDTMDWSAWNDFVNDANVSVEDSATTPSTGEGKEADTQPVASSSIITEREMPVGSLFG